VNYRKMGCPHKQKILKCRECECMCCTRCIQLEVHQCPKLNERIRVDKDNLAKKLVKVEAKKVVSF
jgi:hypothetical protein